MSAESVRIGLHRRDPQELEPGVKVRSFSMLREALPVTGVGTDEYIIPEYTPISNQGGLGTCGTNAWLDMLEMLRGLDMVAQGRLPEVEQLSRLFLYWSCRSYLAEQNKDKGIYLRLGARQLSIMGVCPEEVWPYDESTVFTTPCVDAFLQASDNKIESFFSLESLDDLETSVRANHPGVFGTDVAEPFRHISYEVGRDGVVDGPPSDSIGGHAMIVTGVRRYQGARQWLWRNSWGADWGFNGHVWVTERYMAATHDRWVGTTMKGLLV